MPLKKKMVAVVEVLVRATWALQEVYVGILVRLSSYPGTQFPEGSDNTGRVLQSEILIHQNF
jgi:hypothetical protein